MDEARTYSDVREIVATNLSAVELRRAIRGPDPVKLVGLKPVLLRGTPLTFSTIRHQLGDLSVQVEVGNVMQNATKLMSYKLSRYVSVVEASSAFSIHEIPRLQEVSRPYLSIFDLGKHADYVDAGEALKHFEETHTDVTKCFWIGPSLTVTGWHHDWYANLFFQLQGKKVFHLAPRTTTSAMYPSNKYDPYSTLSWVEHDPFRDDFDKLRFPKFGNVPMLRCSVTAGDALYIPRRVWHHVVALSPCISMSVFGTAAWSAPFDHLQDAIRRIAYRVGLFEMESTTENA